MADSPEQLAELLRDHFADRIDSCVVDLGEVTIEVSAANQIEVCTELRDRPEFRFEQLMDLCGVDYLEYGKAEWVTEDASGSGFSRGVEATSSGRLGMLEESGLEALQGRRRFAAVMNLLSVKNNQRVRVRVYAPDDDMPVLHSVIEVWNGVNWFEREAFDLFGIMFEGHPDLRRIMTDYGFIGHPFRKDFPLIGNVEVRYDAEKQRVIYQPVSIEPRVLVPRVIRESTERANANKAAPEAPEPNEEQAD